MYKAKALIGEKAGEFIYAKDPSLTHDLCKTWKIYCPECKQFLYFSKSKNPEKRISCFGHYDYEDKRCSERSSDTNQSSQQASLSESHEQDLETAETFIETVFYGINVEFFQKLSLEEVNYDSSLLTSSGKWFRENLRQKFSGWINHYCRTIGFLDWKNPKKEVNYLVDWLCVLVRRNDVLKKLLHYCICICGDNQIDTSLVQKKFDAAGLTEEEWICLLALDMVISRLEAMSTSGVCLDKNNIRVSRAYTRLKIPPNNKEATFRGKLSLSVRTWMEIVVRDGRLVFHNYENGRLSSIMLFDQEFIDHFCYLGRDELNYYPDVVQEDFLLLCVEGDDLVIQGFANERYHKSIVKEISKFLLNKSRCSMLLFLEKQFISRDIAEKAAQLTLKATHGGLTPSEAFEKFQALSMK
jgi:hypothetical protein